MDRTVGRLQVGKDYPQHPKNTSLSLGLLAYYRYLSFISDFRSDWRQCETIENWWFYLGVSENRLNPIVPNGFHDHYPVFKWLFHWECTIFSDKPIFTVFSTGFPQAEPRVMDRNPRQELSWRGFWVIFASGFFWWAVPKVRLGICRWHRWPTMKPILLVSVAFCEAHEFHEASRPSPRWCATLRSATHEIRWNNGWMMHGGFQTWGYPQMDGLSWNTFSNRWLGVPPF